MELETEDVRSDTALQPALTVKERSLMVLWPCSYMNQPELETRDCCLCCHESPKSELLNIPPFIEIAGTWLTPSNPINKYFICFRFIAMLYLIFVLIFSFVVFTRDSAAHYWFMYWTEWILICGVTLVIIRFISSLAIYKNTEKAYDININDVDIDSKLWILYKCHKMALYTALPTMTMVVFNFWAFVYTGSGYFNNELDAISSYQKHLTAAVVVWIDFLISAEKMYYKSAIWSIVLGTIFTIWTIIFEIFIHEAEGGKDYIYSTYNWSESITTPLFYYFVSAVILAIFTALPTLIKNLILVYSRIGNKEESEDDSDSAGEPLTDAYI